MRREGELAKWKEIGFDLMPRVNLGSWSDPPVKADLFAAIDQLHALPALPMLDAVRLRMWAPPAWDRDPHGDGVDRAGWSEAEKYSDREDDEGSDGWGPLIPRRKRERKNPRTAYVGDHQYLREEVPDADRFVDAVRHVLGSGSDRDRTVSVEYCYLAPAIYTAGRDRFPGVPETVCWARDRVWEVRV